MRLTPFCNICGKLYAETYTGRLVPDHNHLTGVIRGWLCEPCNANVGIFESDKCQEAKAKEWFKRWVTTYHVRILLHLTCNTGFLFKERKKFRKQYYIAHRYYAGRESSMI